MGNNLKEGPIGQQEQDQQHKFRDHDRKSWDIRKNEGGFVLRDRAGPGHQRACFCLPVMTGLMIAPGMEMKTSRGRLLKIDETGVADKSGDHPDHDQEAGHDYCGARDRTGSPIL